MRLDRVELCDFVMPDGADCNCEATGYVDARTFIGGWQPFFYCRLHRADLVRDMRATGLFTVRDPDDRVGGGTGRSESGPRRGGSDGSGPADA